MVTRSLFGEGRNKGGGGESLNLAVFFFFGTRISLLGLPCLYLYRQTDDTVLYARYILRWWPVSRDSQNKANSAMEAATARATCKQMQIMEITS